MANMVTYVYNFISIEIFSKAHKMWTEETIKEAAQEWANSCQPCNKNWQFNRNWNPEDRLYHSFLAGAKYIINNTQKG